MNSTGTKQPQPRFSDAELRFLRLAAQEKTITTDEIATSMGISEADAQELFHSATRSSGITPYTLSHHKITPYELSVRSGIGWYKELVDKKPFEHMRRNLQQLSKREREVFDLLVLGLKNKQIGDTLKSADDKPLSWHTVSSHVKEIYRKLEIDNRADATRIAIGEGTLPLAKEQPLQQLIQSYCTLSEYERRVFEYTALGMECKNIAPYIRRTKDATASLRAVVYKRLNISNMVEATRMWVALRIEADRLQAEENKAQALGATADATQSAPPITAETEAPSNQIKGNTTISYGTHQYAVSPEAAGSFTDRFASRHPSLDPRWR